MEKEVETLKQLYEVLDETYQHFKDGMVGIDMLIAICHDISKEQKLLNKITNQRNREKGIISVIPE